MLRWLCVPPERLCLLYACNISLASKKVKQFLAYDIPASTGAFPLLWVPAQLRQLMIKNGDIEDTSQLSTVPDQREA
jgi:hypothetical protein